MYAEFRYGNKFINHIYCCCLALVMILYDRMFEPYVRRLASKTIVVEKSKLNLLVRSYFH